MNIIWGYTPTEEEPILKKLGSEIIEAKQVFSALIFRQGIKGICIQIDSLEDNPEVTLDLIVDDIKILTSTFSPAIPKKYRFEIEEINYPKLKIEVIISINQGSISLPISAVGNGMGFQKIENKFVPTKHFGLGLIVP